IEGKFQSPPYTEEAMNYIYRRNKHHLRFRDAFQSSSVNAAMVNLFSANYCKRQFHQKMFSNFQNQFNGEMA
ncbi:MAG: hypothetical protein QGH52_05745, partial [Prochlorococcaceae cyanobacterium ETNP1_MAG_8]|nr:hypothetical protein [Prochlorococcaceae cyanobacterium ETNP1_MAG_8]